MKLSIFAVNDIEDVNEFHGREAGGNRAIGLQDAEDEMITAIDEHRMSPAKLSATRFLTFLGNRRLTIAKLKELPIEEQKRLKKEFLGD
jgi:hypothetical protein